MKLLIAILALALPAIAQDITAEEIAAKRKAEVIALVRGIQERAKAAEAEATEARAAKTAINEVVKAQAERLIGMGGLAAQLNAAEGATKVLQDAMDGLRVQVRELEKLTAKLTADLATEKAAKAKWMERANKLMVACSALVTAWLFAQLAFLPIWWRVGVALAVGAATYGVLYGVL